MKEAGEYFVPDDDKYMGNLYVSQGGCDVDLIENYKGRVAVDCGAHSGSVSHKLSEGFEKVYCYEPDPAIYECLVAKKKWNMRCRNKALGAMTWGTVGTSRRISDNSGSTWCDPGGVVPLVSLDSEDIKDVDLIKIDCEGMDYFVVLGAIQTILRYRPVIIYEKKEKLNRKYGVYGGIFLDDPSSSLLGRLGYKGRSVRKNMIWERA